MESASGTSGDAGRTGGWRRRGAVVRLAPRGFAGTIPGPWSPSIAWVGPLHDLRISVTDRCNFRCTYCMPKEVFGRDYAFLPRDQVLSFEEIERAARAFVALGVEKLRITGGEPLVRRGLPDLIAMLAALRTTDGRAARPDPDDERRGAARRWPGRSRTPGCGG